MGKTVKEGKGLIGRGRSMHCHREMKQLDKVRRISSNLATLEHKVEDKALRLK